MGKRSRSRSREQVPSGEVGPRQPCPCGSGKRYKHCHGAPGGAAPAYVARPFQGLPSECDVIAMRDLVPAATAPLALEDSDRPVLLCSLLPSAVPAMVRESGEIWLGLQVRHQFGDPSRDLAAVLERALEAETGAVGLTDPPGPGPRLQDLVGDQELTVTVHDGFGFWVADVETTPELQAALEQADAAATPTSRLGSVEAAYWTDVGTKEHLRWVMPYDEDPLLDALARLHASGRDTLVEGSRLVGMFRAYGLLAPVWDLEPGTGAEVLEQPAAAFEEALAEALADDSALSAEERSARAGLANRQVTLR
jgi:Family of unknown function (DUF5926)/SEC-C motif